MKRHQMPPAVAFFHPERHFADRLQKRRTADVAVAAHDPDDLRIAVTRATNRPWRARFPA
jgi:hypothetical protein